MPVPLQPEPFDEVAEDKQTIELMRETVKCDPLSTPLHKQEIERYSDLGSIRSERSESGSIRQHSTGIIPVSNRSQRSVPPTQKTSGDSPHLQSSQGPSDLLFPQLRPLKGREHWVEKLNMLLENRRVISEESTLEVESPQQSVLNISEWETAMEEFATVCSEEDGCPEIPVKEMDLRVVGDIHGQLADLLHRILGPMLREKTERPCYWLFLGDLVDRGPHGVECLAIVTLMKIIYPSRVTILRGNHEDAPITYQYGFKTECDRKFGKEGQRAWIAAVAAFTQIPLAAVVDMIGPRKKFWFCHGGLSKELQNSPDPIEAINRIHQAERLPVEYWKERDPEQQDLGSALPQIPELSPEDKCVKVGLMWSDPTDWELGAEMEGFVRSARGAGEMWEAAVSEAFCAKYELEFICRAHQLVHAGFKKEHSDRVYTIFSAPNYCQMGNSGCVLVIRADGTSEFDVYDQTDERLWNEPPTAVIPKEFLEGDDEG